MAPHEQPPATQEHPPRISAAPALGVLAAVTAAGIIASKMKAGPLLFVAGAAASAWLAKRRLERARRPLELLPARPAAEEAPLAAAPPPPEPEQIIVPPAPEQQVATAVDAWLARQIAREQEAPVITLDRLDVPAPPVSQPEPAPLPQIEIETPAPVMEETVPVLSAPPAVIEPPVEPLFAEPLPPIKTTAPAAVLPMEPAQEIFGLRDEEPPARAAPSSFFTDTFLDDKLNAPLPPPKISPATLQALGIEPKETNPDSSWILGIEPLPSWDELAAPPKAAETEPEPAPEPEATAASGFMMEAPAATSEEDAPAAPTSPEFVPSLFQGAAVPDEIDISNLFSAESPSQPPAPAPPAPPSLASNVPPLAAPTAAPLEMEVPLTSLLDTPVASPDEAIRPPSVPLFPQAKLESEVPVEAQTQPRPVFVAPRRAVEPPAPVPWPPPVVEVPAAVVESAPAPTPAEPPPSSTVPEIEVAVAAPGEASFDDPLAAMAAHGTPASAAQPPPPLRPLAPVVEAEIIVRPRGLAAPAVVAKAPSTPLHPPPSADPAPEATPPPSPPPLAGLPPAPVVVPREQRAKRTWRSWWRGE